MHCGVTKKAKRNVGHAIAAMQADQSWRAKPVWPPPPTAAVFAKRSGMNFKSPPFNNLQPMLTNAIARLAKLRRRTILAAQQLGCFMLIPPNFKKNRLLAALSGDEWQRLLPRLETVHWPLGQAIYEPGTTLNHIYFPTTAMISLTYEMENGASAQIAMVGNEGVLGISLFMGGESTSSRAVVTSAGHSLMLPAETIKEEFARSGPVMHLLLRYTQALITQMAQTAACNRHHTVDRQLCRWLLMSLDRLQGSHLAMTHELIANMLGVRREGVTEAALKLQAAGLIRYARGHISVLNRQGLVQRSCECYAVVKNEYDRLLPMGTHS